MPYLSVADFKYGMDRRRPRVAGLPGTLWTLKNAVITRGGDIERIKKWVAEYTLPAGTFGLAGIKGRPYVFGKGTAPVGIPPDVQYLALTFGGGATLIKVHDAKPFDGKMYVITEWSDGVIRHFYNGVEITTEWTTRADAKFSYSTVALALATKINSRSDVVASANGVNVKVTAKTAGTAFTIVGAATDVDADASLPTAVVSTLQANVAAVAEVRATGTVMITGGTSSPGVNKVTQITIAGHDLLASPVNWITSHAVTAAAIVAAINTRAEAGYQASAIGAVITIQAPPGTGATVNGQAFTRTVGGNVTTSSAALAGGVTAVTAVKQISQVVIAAGTADSTDLWKITVNGTDYQITGRGSAMPLFCHITKRRVWAPIGSALYFCKLGDPTIWSTLAPAPATDPGFIEMSSDSEGSDDLISLADYNGNTAIFSDTNIRIYALTTDATLISIIQTIGNTGAQAAGATVSFGSTDVFYPDISGVRSLRSRQGYDAAFASDVGSPIDTYLQDIMKSVGSAVVREAKAVIEPFDGRYMISIGSRIIQLSFFPGASITAWSETELPFTVQQMVRVGRSIMARSGDTIYVYGGLAGDTYPGADEYVVEAVTPFLSSQDPANQKQQDGFDMAGEGDWEVYLLVDPNNLDAKVRVGVVNKITYPTGAIKAVGLTSHTAVQFTSKSAGRCTLSSFALHYEKGETE
jgi:hypothetical protein